MYIVDAHDQVSPRLDLPQSSVGAPCPIVLSDEYTLVLAYYLEARHPEWDGSNIRVIDPATSNEPVAVVAFHGYAAFMFGPPNDEAFSGHPLASRGLGPYRTFEVEHSSWIRSLERMNSVHPYHRPESYRSLVHYIFAFHDSTLECVAESFTLRRFQGSLKSILPEMQAFLKW